MSLTNGQKDTNKNNHTKDNLFTRIQPALLVNARGLPAPQALRAGIRSSFKQG
jgi:hypothetical protein